MRILGCWEGIQIIWSLFLKKMTMDSEQYLEHLLTSDCHSSEHNSMLLVVNGNCIEDVKDN